MAKTSISIAAQNTFTTPMNVPRDSIVVVLNSPGGTGVGVARVQIQDYSDPANPGGWDSPDSLKFPVVSGVCQMHIIDIPISNQRVRVGFATGEYTSGTLTGRIQYG